MNVILDALPDRVRVGGVVFTLCTDYRAGVRFELLAERGEVNVTKLLAPFYPEGLPHDVAGAADAAMWFYRCGDTSQIDDKPAQKRGYSFSVDADAIFSDFWRFYALDLTKDTLHWWAFRALLRGLPEDSAFKQRVYYRTCDLKGLPKKEQDRIRKIRREIEIEHEKKLTLAERNQRMVDYVKKRAKGVDRHG